MPARLLPLAPDDFSTVARLAETIWREHYTKIVGQAQVEYMLRGRYVPESLSKYVGATDRWFRLLVDEETPVGYCSYSLSSPDEMKLEQLYLLADLRGRGLGAVMLKHVEAEARAHGRATLMLTVNRRNVGAIGLYERSGFTVREEAVFDIGGGFVMDDYVMVKTL